MNGSSVTETDVIIIGGGATGAGVARDCARRGLKAVLLERHDIAHQAVIACYVLLSKRQTSLMPLIANLTQALRYS